MAHGRLLLMTMLACALLAGPAAAGPNAYGTIFVHDANFVIQTDYSTLCGLGTAPVTCQVADVDLEGSSPDTHKLWKVYAAFVPGSYPRLKGMTFGVSYDPELRITQ